MIEMSEIDARAEHNRRILERRQGVPAKRMTQLEAMMDPTCPIRFEQNDNEPPSNEKPPTEAGGVD